MYFKYGNVLCNKVNELNKLLENLIVRKTRLMTAKATALLLEKNSFNKPVITNQTSKLVADVLAKQNDKKILCPICFENGINQPINEESCEFIENYNLTNLSQIHNDIECVDNEKNENDGIKEFFNQPFNEISCTFMENNSLNPQSHERCYF